MRGVRKCLRLTFSVLFAIIIQTGQERLGSCFYHMYKGVTVLKIKSLAMKLAAAALTAVLAFQNPLRAFAAGKQVYISDMLISYAKSRSAEDIAAAKKWLTDKGYTVLGQDLNADTASIVSTARPVFLGYKMTSDPEDAVTDIRLMNMNGDYSYDDYKELVISRREEIGQFLDQTKAALKSYRENFSIVQDILDDYDMSYEEIGTVLAEHPDDFDSGCCRAMITYEMLNLYTDDDTGYRLGDLLLEPIVEEISDWTARRDGEWDPDAADGAHADMTTIMMQGNTAAVVSMMNALAYSADPDCESTFLSRAARSEGLDGILSRYQEMYPAQSASRIQTLVKADYDSDALILAGGLERLKSAAACYTASGLDRNADSAEVEAYFQAHKDQSPLTWMNGGLLTEGLRNVKMAGVTLFDLLCTDQYDFSRPEDRAELYPLLDAMTESQRALLTYVPADTLFLTALTERDDEWRAVYDSNHENVLSAQSMSVYEGVNRSMFDTDGGTALTRTALDHQTATHEVYNGQIGESARVTAIRMLGLTSLVSFGIGIGCLTVGKVASRAFVNSQRELISSNILDSANGRWVADVTYEYDPDIEYFENKMNPLSENKVGYIFKTVGTVICIAAALMMIAAGALAIIEMVDTWVHFKSIPKYIVHGRELEKTASGSEPQWAYTYYQCVKCNRAELGLVNAYTEKMSDCGDLNGDAGKEWVAVYLTKDKAAGSPIAAKSLTVSTQQKTPLGSSALSYFGEETPANLSNPNYVYNNNAPEVYIYFKHNDAAFSGTVSSAGTAVLIGTLAVLAGGAIGYLACGKIWKKRKEEAIEA